MQSPIFRPGRHGWQRDLLPGGILIAVLLCAAVSRADDPDPGPPKFSFSGFGTLGVVHSSEDQADFTSTIFKPDGAGFTHPWSADSDSVLALQVALRPTRKLSAAMQVVSEQKHDGTYWPHVEWANVKYQFTPDFSIRVGRTVLPVFMVTDSRKIGYANPWVRPPLEVYSLAPITNNDGIDAIYRLRVKAATNTLQVSAGRCDSRFPGGGGFGTGTLEAREMVTLVDTLEKGSFTLRLNFGRTRLTVPEFAPVFDGFRQFGPEGMAIADRYDVDESLVTFLGVGVGYDPGPWFVMGEWGRINTRSAIGVKAGFYVSGGYRVRKAFTPYITYAQVTADGNTSDPGLTLAALPPSLAGPAAGLNAVLNSFLASKVVQNTITVGGRWDFRKNAALKLQLDHSRHGPGSPGTLVNLQPGFRPGGNVTVFSAAIDFVFP